MISLRGSQALPHFRLERLLRELSHEVPQINVLHAEYRYFVDLSATLNKSEEAILSNLLNSGLTSSRDTDLPQGTLILVVPRKGTISSWSSKATDIAQHCGLKNIKRIECGIAYYIEASEKLTWGDVQTMAVFLHDPMVEDVLYDLEHAATLFQKFPPKPPESLPILQGGLTALQELNKKWQLSLEEEELQFLLESYEKLNRNPTDVELMTFAALNSLHAHQKIFQSSWIIDGHFNPQSLLSMIKNTYHVNSRGILSAYHDNAAAFYGNDSLAFFPDPNTGNYAYHPEPLHMVVKVETHNHPTMISPYFGAATGVGSELRDESAMGRGAKPKAGLFGLSLSHLRIPDFIQAWEISHGRPPHIASALEIILQAPLGAAQYANEFGRPTLCGYVRIFEQDLQEPLGIVRGYHKPIMIAGGFGNIRESQLEKAPLSAGALILSLGGPAMKTGLGRRVTPSFSSSKEGSMDFISVQYGNAEMQHRAQEVINHCVAMGANNPILAIHDVGSGGLAYAVPEMIWRQFLGGVFELRDIYSADASLSSLDLWCNEAEERYVVGIEKDKLDILKEIAAREACPLSVIGELITDPILKCHDREYDTDPVDLPLTVLFDTPTLKPRQISSVPSLHFPLENKGVDLMEAVIRVLRLPSVADKSCLITICDRSVTGLVARDQMVGPWQIPVADCAVTACSYQGYQGEAMAIGERAPIALISPEASARMAVAEAITNIAAANIGALSDLRLSANWMAGCGYQDEDRKLFEAVKALSLEFCPALNLTIPVGKESLSMRSAWLDNGLEKEMIAPLSVVISAFAPVMDIRRTLTPELQTTEDSCLVFIDLGSGKQRLGGSALATVYNNLGNDCPDVENPESLKVFFNCIQQLNLEDKLLSYHDRSDGGLFVTLCEMAFASHVGLQIDLTDLGSNLLAILFNEELGAVLQVRADEVEGILLELSEQGLTHCHTIGKIAKDHITFLHNDTVIFSADRLDLQRIWSETSFHLQSLRDNPRMAKKLYETIEDRDDPGLNAKLSFELSDLDVVAPPFVHGNTRPTVAILREQGVNGHTEMAAAFYRAGFDVVDVHMNDLASGSQQLSQFKGLAVCGGFSYGDVLGAGKGWAKRILFNTLLRDQFEAFFQRPETFTLGVSNGCQMLASLKTLIPGAEDWPNFIRNTSEQFESRLSLVEIEPSPSILLEGMEGSRIPIPVAHGAGRAEFLDEDAQHRALHQHLVTLRFVDSRGRKTKVYPANPNGSPLGITGLTTPDGRATIMMPHPERAFRTVQFSWHPKEWGEAGPWLKLFQNARRFVG